MIAAWSAFVILALVLVASHSLPTLPAVRRVLVATLGERVYLTAYSILSLAVLSGFIWLYARIDAGPQLYLPPPGARWVALLLMPVAVYLMLARLTTRPAWSPKAARSGAAQSDDDGVYGLTRVPGSIGLLLWVVLHLLNTGDTRRVILFLALGAIAALAILKHELILRRTADSAAIAYRKRTSLLPGLALAEGRGRTGIGWWRPLVAALLFAGLLFAHPHLLGVDPLTGL